MGSNNDNASKESLKNNMIKKLFFKRFYFIFIIGICPFFSFSHIYLNVKQNKFVVDSCIQYKFNTNKDSVPFEKTINKHDSRGNNVLTQIYLWNNVIKKWEITTKIEIAFNKFDKEISHKKYYFNKEKNIWELSPGGLVQNEDTNFESEYDSLGREIKEIKDIVFKIETLYDDKKNIKTEILYRKVIAIYPLPKDISSYPWIPEEKNEYYHDNNGNEIKHIIYSWIESIKEWRARATYIKCFDNKGRPTSGEDIYFNNSRGWEHKVDTVLKYDINGFPTLQIGYIYNENNKKWIPDFKVEESHDINGNTLFRSGYNWDDSNKKWIPNSKFETVYDHNSHKISEIEYRWDDKSNQVVIWNKYHYDFDIRTNQSIRTNAYSMDETTMQLYNSYNLIIINDSNKVSKNYYYNQDYFKTLPKQIETIEYYDLLGNLIKYKEFDFDNNSKSPIDSKEIIYYYSKID